MTLRRIERQGNNMNWTNEMENITTWVNKNASDAEPYRLPFDDVAIAVTVGLLLPMALFGIVANLLTIVVVYRAPKLRSIFNYFIMSLAFSDLLSTVISPLALYRRIWGFKYWSISNVLCKFYWGGDMATSTATSYHILAFSALRFVSVAMPHIFNKIKFTHAKACIVCIWIIAIGTGFIPFVLFMGVTEIDRSTPSINWEWPSCTLQLQWIAEYLLHSKYGYLVKFYIPLGLIIFQSTATSLLIRYRRLIRLKMRRDRPSDINREKTEAKRQKKENRAILQLALIVGSFSIGYLPNTIYLVVSPKLKPRTYEDKVLFWWFGTIVYICLRFSECLNPIFYNLASSKLRCETLRLLKRICRRNKGNLPSIRKSASSLTAA